jgi:peptidoglycan/LPS O-acetylase OafA/YrhL
MRTLGKYSYALYLFQAPVDHLLTRFGAGPDVVGRLAYFPLGVGVTLALAWTSWHLWERHWLQLSAPHSRPPELLPVP